MNKLFIIIKINRIDTKFNISKGLAEVPVQPFVRLDLTFKINLRNKHD